jgi:hypothetical protein
MSIWTQLKYFRIAENWGDPWKMSGALLLVVDLIRHYFGDNKFIVHCGYAVDGHSENSQHYVGNGIDFHVVGMTLQEAYRKMVDVLELLNLTEFVAMGIYPNWNSSGFHLSLSRRKKRWAYVNGKQVGIDIAFI